MQQTIQPAPWAGFFCPATRDPLCYNRGMIKREFGYLTWRSPESDTAAAQLEQDGYVLVENIFDPVEVAILANEINRVFETEPADVRGGNASGREMFRYAMLNRSAACQQALAHPKILAVIEPLLGEDCHVIANTAWRNPPSSEGLHGGHHWHIDAGPHVPLPPGVSWPENIPHPVFAIGTHLFLEDCALADGPTGVIPGSHRSGAHPPLDRLLDDTLTYNDVGVTALTAKAGDVCFFVSDVWHRRMPTLPGDRGRFFLQMHYGRRDIAQRLLPTDQANQLSEAAIERAATEREQTLIGLHRPFFYDG